MDRRGAPATIHAQSQLAGQLQAAEGQGLIKTEEGHCTVSMLLFVGTALLLLHKTALLLPAVTAQAPTGRLVSVSSRIAQPAAQLSGGLVWHMLSVQLVFEAGDRNKQQCLPHMGGWR